MAERQEDFEFMKLNNGGRPARSGKRRPVARTLPPFRFWFTASLMVLFVIAGVAAFFKTERYLIRDAHFVLPGPPDPGQELSTFRIRGLSNSSRERVMQVFDRDFGRSVYLLPLAARRNSLLEIDWVREAAISRRWPNELQIELTEREPVAFAQLPATAGDGTPTFRSMLIDAEGVLLTPPRKVQYHLPVLTGMAPRDRLAARRERVRQMLRLLNDAGDLAQKISEVDAGDIHNLKVTQPMDDRVVVLLLGDQNFKKRLENFFNHYPEIKKRLSNAKVLDMRLEDRITVVDTVAQVGYPSGGDE